jgi:hypothetical protein
MAVAGLKPGKNRYNLRLLDCSKMAVVLDASVCASIHF